MIVQRRIFYGKVGVGEQLVEHLTAGELLFRKHGAAIRPRIMSDYHSGRTDRVVAEWEAATLDEITAVESTVLDYPDGREEFRKWFEGLRELIDYAEVETWQLH